jgi:hypothetical protein
MPIVIMIIVIVMIVKMITMLVVVMMMVVVVVVMMLMMMMTLMMMMMMMMIQCQDVTVVAGICTESAAQPVLVCTPPSILQPKLRIEPCCRQPWQLPCTCVCWNAGRGNSCIALQRPSRWALAFVFHSD